MAKRVLGASGIELVDEWTVRDASGRRLADLDLACVELQVGVECQSDVVELWWSDLQRIDEVVIEITAALGRARRLRSGGTGSWNP